MLRPQLTCTTFIMSGQRVSPSTFGRCWPGAPAEGDGMSRFSGKVVLVTGAGQGIGRATAERFAAEGAKVCALDWDATRVEETVQALAPLTPPSPPEGGVGGVRGGGGAVEGIAGDISRRQDVRRAVE